MLDAEQEIDFEVDDLRDTRIGVAFCVLSVSVFAGYLATWVWVSFLLSLAVTLTTGIVGCVALSFWFSRRMKKIGRR